MRSPTSKHAVSTAPRTAGVVALVVMAACGRFQGDHPGHPASSDVVDDADAEAAEVDGSGDDAEGTGSGVDTTPPPPLPAFFLDCPDPAQHPELDGCPRPLQCAEDRDELAAVVADMGIFGPPWERQAMAADRSDGVGTVRCLLAEGCPVVEQVVNIGPDDPHLTPYRMVGADASDLWFEGRDLIRFKKASGEMRGRPVESTSNTRVGIRGGVVALCGFAATNPPERGIGLMANLDTDLNWRWATSYMSGMEFLAVDQTRREIYVGRGDWGAADFAGELRTQTPPWFGIMVYDLDTGAMKSCHKLDDDPDYTWVGFRAVVAGDFLVGPADHRQVVFDLRTRQAVNLPKARPASGFSASGDTSAFVLTPETLMIPGNRDLYWLSSTDGALRNTVRASEGIFSGAETVDLAGRLYRHTGNRGVAIHDVTTGRRLEETPPYLRYVNDAPLVAADGVLIIAPTGEVVGLEPGTWRPLWRVSLGENVDAEGAPLLDADGRVWIYDRKRRLMSIRTVHGGLAHTPMATPRVNMLGSTEAPLPPFQTAPAPRTWRWPEEVEGSGEGRGEGSASPTP